MLKQLLWAFLAIGVGLLLAGAIAPLTLFFLPEAFRGPATVWTIAIVCVLAAVAVVSKMGKGNDTGPER
jgi:hypothetical protein